MKSIYYYYLRAVWYMGVAKGEITKPLQFWNETLLILIYLKTMGIIPTIYWTIGIYMGIYVLFIIFGKILVLIGVVAYNNRLGNTQNPEIMEIIKRLERIEEKL